MSARGLESLLSVIGGHDPDALIEVRYRPGGAMAQRFVKLDCLSGLASFIERCSTTGDVYVGAAPRTRPKGGRDAVEHVWSLWADCDGPDAVAALKTFRPMPSVIVATGSGSNVQAWWPLTDPLSANGVEEANRRLARALGADERATDAARILRPPGTWNWKHDPPTKVRCHWLACPLICNSAEGVIGHLPEVGITSHENVSRAINEDSLLAIPPAQYITALTGMSPDRGGKVRCPFHSGGQERTPSLHVYANPSDGWHCYGCGRGGTLYDFAALLWNTGTRGDSFVELKQRLVDELGVAA